MRFWENDDLGKLILRVTLAVLMLFHGYAKLTHGVGFIEGMLTGAGLPAIMAYGVYIGEIIAPILLILGVQVRLSALVIVFTILTAIFLVHINDIFTVTKHGAWGIELPMFFLLASLAIIFLGAGKYTISLFKKE